MEEIERAQAEGQVDDRTAQGADLRRAAIREGYTQLSRDDYEAMTTGGGSDRGRRQARQAGKVDGEGGGREGGREGGRARLALRACCYGGVRIVGEGVVQTAGSGSQKDPLLAAHPRNARR